MVDQIVVRVEGQRWLVQATSEGLMCAPVEIEGRWMVFHVDERVLIVPGQPLERPLVNHRIHVTEICRRALSRTCDDVSANSN